MEKENGKAEVSFIEWLKLSAERENVQSITDAINNTFPADAQNKAVLNMIAYEDALTQYADEIRPVLTERGADLFKFFCTLRYGNEEQTRIFHAVIDAFFFNGDKAAALSDFFDFAASISADKIAEVIQSTYKPTIDIFRPYKGKKTDIDGQMSFAFELDVASKADKQAGLQAVTNYALTFQDLDGVKYPRNLGEYDLRVYSALGSLYKNGKSYLTLNDVGRAMGLKTTPNAAQRDKILSSIKKMMSGLVVINNSQEVKRYNYPFTGERWHNLLAADVIPDITINGQHGSYIHLLRMPVLLEWAIARRQYTTLPIEVYQVPLSLTERTLAIENYLILRIAERGKDKADKGKHTILLDTMFKELNINRGKSASALMEQKRAIETAETVLKHFVSIGFISGYQITKDRITWSESGL